MRVLFLFAPSPGRQKNGALPETNFWLAAVTFSPKRVVQAVGALKQIRGDVGRSRAWVRLALNDGEVVNYLSAMKDSKLLSDFYEKDALIRDLETMDVIIKYLLGIQVYKFELALNSSILNRWQTPPLIMCGLWVPDRVEEEPPAEAVDAVSELDQAEKAEAEAEAQKAALQRFRPVYSESFLSRFVENSGYWREIQISNEPRASARGFSDPPALTILLVFRGLLNEDEALALILKSTGSGTRSRSSQKTTPPDSAQNSPVDSGPLTRRMKRAAQKNPDSPLAKVPEEVRLASKGGSGGSGGSEETDVDSVEKAEPSSSSEMSRDLTATDSEQNAAPGELNATKESDSSFGEDSFDVYAMADESGSADENGSGARAQTGPRTDTGYIGRIIEEIENEYKMSRQSSSASASASSSMKEREGMNAFSSAGQFIADVVAIPRLSGFIESWYPFNADKHFDAAGKKRKKRRKTNETTPKTGFTLKDDYSVAGLNVEDSHYMMELFDRTPAEVGLDRQDYQCHGCTKAIGAIFGAAKVCAYTKRYYCDECHSDQSAAIPTKIVHAWDLRPFRVCDKAKQFLDTIRVEPIIDIKSFHKSIFNQFSSCPVAPVLTLRKKLHYMHVYLLTCRDQEPLEGLRVLLGDREYLHGSVDMYSVRDLEEIGNGKLLELLEKAANHCTDHIDGCLLCSGKGFICEICRGEDVVYPFSDKITQCEKCCTVFHAECSNKIQSCPKCDRYESRDLDWQVSYARMKRNDVDLLA